MVSEFRVDSWGKRFVALSNQLIHFLIAKNLLRCIFCILVAFRYMSGKRHVHELAHSVRKNKKITPFQHNASIFLRRPSVFQLLSMRHGLAKDYARYAAQEVLKRDVFLEAVPREFQAALFPWLTQAVRGELERNGGISEFSWVFTRNGRRAQLNDFLSDNRIITLINTTWVASDVAIGKAQRKSNAAWICENLTYLPNLNEMTQAQIVALGEVLTRYCKTHDLSSRQDGFDERLSE